MVDVLGHERAREMWMLCRRIPAAQALDRGLANTVVPLDPLDAEVRRWADELLAMSPTMLTLIKAGLRERVNPYFDINVSDMLRAHAPEFLSSGEKMEGAKAFLEKRRPDFSR